MPPPSRLSRCMCNSYQDWKASVKLTFAHAFQLLRLAQHGVQPDLFMLILNPTHDPALELHTFGDHTLISTVDSEMQTIDHLYLGYVSVIAEASCNGPRVSTLELHSALVSTDKAITFTTTPSYSIEQTGSIREDDMAEGRCNCGNIKVSIPGLPDQSAICYCANCRRAGSSIGSIVYIFDKSDVTINDPNSNLKSYTDSDTKSGNTLTRQFCGNCGCPIASLLSDDSPKIILKGGLFAQIPKPGMKSFEQEEPAWMKIAS